VELTSLHTTTQVTVAGPVVYLRRRRPPAPTCRDEALAAIGRLVGRTGEEASTVATVFTEMAALGTAYKEGAVGNVTVAECIDWFSFRGLHGEIGLIPRSSTRTATAAQPCPSNRLTSSCTSPSSPAPDTRRRAGGPVQPPHDF
jgi:hypothetical protein